MDTFKTRPGSSEELLITEENFTNKTKKQFPYVMKENGKNVYKAICPACDNPIRIVGLYKREEDVKRKPYGRHTPSDLPGLTVYNEEDYLNCPYHNPNQSNDGAKRRPGDKKSSWIYDLMKEHFDLIISILEVYIYTLVTILQKHCCKIGKIMKDGDIIIQIIIIFHICCCMPKNHIEYSDN